MEDYIMKKFALLLITALVMFNCKGQTSASASGANDSPERIARKEKPNPDIQVRVNKTFDEKGNVIGYDSTYSYVYNYSDSNMNTAQEDSTISEFKNNFPENFRMNIDRGFDNDPLLNDPALSFRNSGSNDFIQQFKAEIAEFEQTLARLDSLNRQLLSQNYSSDIKKNSQKM
jgi:hypothetical protein